MCVISYLGIKICKNQDKRVDLNFNPLIENILKKYDMWLLRDLCISGRILLFQSENLSWLVYTAIVLDVPPKKVKQIDMKIFNFIWKNKPHQNKQCCAKHTVEGV